MGFKSRGQMRRCLEMVHKGTMKKEMFDKYLKDTPDIDELPDSVEAALENNLADKVKTVGNLKYILRSRVVK